MTVPVESKEPNTGSRVHKALAALVGGMAGYGGVAGLSQLSSIAAGPPKAKFNTPIKGRDEAATMNRVIEIAEANGWPEERHLTINMPVWGTAGPNYTPKFKEPTAGGKVVEKIQIPIGLADEIIGHELGHAMPKSKAGLFMRNLSGIVQRKPMMALPIALASTGLIDEDNPVAKAAPYVGAAQFAAILAEEMRANLRGHELLKTVGAHTNFRQLLRMSTPTVSYLAKAAPLIGAPIGIAKGIQLYEKAKREGIPLTPYRAVTKNIHTLANTSPRPVTMRELRALTQVKQNT